MIDAKGLDAWPGLVDSGTLLGLFEVGSLSETQDFADSAQFQPELRTSVALHPDSELIPVTRANGVLTAYVQPTGGLISGQGCLIDLDGWVPSEMLLADRLALNVNIPSYTPPGLDPSRSRNGDDPNARRKERLDAIREQFRLALAFDKVSQGAKDQHDPGVPNDPRLAALVPFAKGEKPVIFRADRRVEILDALAIAEELKLKAIITGGADAWKVVDRLKALKVPVLIGGTLRIPTEPTDPYDAPYANPARLFEAGIPFAIRSGGVGPDQATAGRNLPYEAAMAVSYGLPEAEALRSVTIRPAEILGVADKVGSLEPGKIANVVLTAGHILQPTAEVKALFIGGKPLAPDSRHTRLYQKYRRRLSDIRAGWRPWVSRRFKSTPRRPPPRPPPPPPRRATPPRGVETRARTRSGEPSTPTPRLAVGLHGAVDVGQQEPGEEGGRAPEAQQQLGQHARCSGSRRSRPTPFGAPSTPASATAGTIGPPLFAACWEYTGGSPGVGGSNGWASARPLEGSAGFEIRAGREAMRPRSKPASRRSVRPARASPIKGEGRPPAGAAPSMGVPSGPLQEARIATTAPDGSDTRSFAERSGRRSISTKSNAATLAFSVAEGGAGRSALGGDHAGGPAGMVAQGGGGAGAGAGGGVDGGEGLPGSEDTTPFPVEGVGETVTGKGTRTV